MKFDEAIERFLQENSQLTENTRLCYRRDLVVFCNWLMARGEKEPSIANITTLQVDTFHVGLFDGGLKLMSVHRHASALRSFFTWAIEQCLVDSNPVPPASLLRVTQLMEPDVLDKPLKPADLLRLCSAPKGDGPRALRDRAMLALLCTGQFRTSQLLSLTMENVNLAHHTVCFTRISGHQIIVALADKGLAYEALSQYLGKARPFFARKKENNRVLFLTQRGAPMSRMMFWKLIRRYGFAVGLPNLNSAIVQFSGSLAVADENAAAHALRVLRMAAALLPREACAVASA